MFVLVYSSSAFTCHPIIDAMNSRYWESIVKLTAKLELVVQTRSGIIFHPVHQLGQITWTHLIKRKVLLSGLTPLSRPAYNFVIFLSSIRSIEICYGRYKTESFQLFKGLPKFLFPFGWYIRIIFGVLSELILSTCSFQIFLYWYMNSVICEICNSVKSLHFFCGPNECILQSSSGNAFLLLSSVLPLRM
jgi:hypothetical protein